MYPARGSAGGPVAAGGSMPLAEQQDKDKLVSNADSGAVDSGFDSGYNLSSDNFTSSSSVSAEPAIQASSASKQVEEVSQTFDSGVALESDVTDLCKSLIQLQMSRKEAKPNPWEPYFLQNDDGDTYLHLAIIHENAEVAAKLIRGASRVWLDIQNDIGQTALHLAVLTEQPRIVRWLLVAGAKPGIRDIEGNTALHLACLHRRNECAKQLLTPLSTAELHTSPAQQSPTKLPQDLEQWNYNGKRCVHIAAETSNIELLRYLVGAGADVNSREGKAGLTPLHIAIENGNEPLVNFLLDECPKLRIEAVTYAGLTAYQLACIQHNQTLQNGLKRRGAEPLSPPESDEETDESDDSMDDEQ
uniref:Putative developmental protein cactus n=1 Tax=Culex tarsalis TaxID=7177 RepID=A0A1Q3EXG1_CULTA